MRILVKNRKGKKKSFFCKNRTLLARVFESKIEEKELEATRAGHLCIDSVSTK